MSVERRATVIEALAQPSGDLSRLAEATKQLDAEPFDLLVHAAWNVPLQTRRERAGRVRKERKDFWDWYSPQARVVLNDVLDKYIDHGVT